MKLRDNNDRISGVRLACGLLAALGVVFSLSSKASEDGVIDLLFIGHDEREGSGYHLSHVYAPRFNESLGKEKIRMDYRENLSLLTDEGLENVDAVMLYANYEHLSSEQESALLRFVEEGGAFLPIHSASACFGDSDAYVALVGGRFHSHGMETFTTRIAPGQENHPVVRGYEGFETRDETYVHSDHNEDGRTVLMLREDEPWTWVREQGEGRVFYTAYGHDENTWEQTAFHDLLIRGILWSVGSEKREANRALVASLPSTDYEAKDTIPNYRKVEPAPRLQRPLEPEGSEALTMVPEGFELQFFVGEPDIAKPITFAWDDRGRLFVVEAVDYPHGLQEDGKGKDRISICEDTDGDGRANGCKVFADGLNMATGLVAVDGGWIVSQVPHFLFLKDTNGDDRADVRRVINDGWGTFDTHAGPSNLAYGHDNHIWGAVGYSAVESEDQGKFQNGVYRMNVDGSNIEPIGQFNNNTWGLGLSEDFEVFGSTANNAPAWHVPVWRSFVYGRHEEVPPKMAAKIDSFSQVFPATPNYLQVDAHGRYTAGAGFNLYTARAFPERFWNQGAFIGEPTAHLLGQFFLEKDGSSYHAWNGGSFMTSTDEWFSPVDARVGPDGQLWVADWYNFIIQHNPTPTEESAGFDTENGKGNAHVNPLRDHTHGRIYRVVAKDAPKSQPLNLHQASTEKLVNALSNDNMFWRITAQRKLVQEQRRDAIPALRAILEGEPTIDAVGLDVAAIHAIWTLQGLKAFDLSDAESVSAVEQALQHPAASVRKNAVRALIESGGDENLAGAAEHLLDDDPGIRLWALLAISLQSPSEAAAHQLLEHRAELTEDQWLAEAFVQAALRHGADYWYALSGGDYQRGNRFLEGFERAEDTPEYVLTRRYLSAHADNFADVMADWRSLSGERLEPMSTAVVDLWLDQQRQPNEAELQRFQTLIDKLDSNAQMALKLRASGLALDFDKVSAEAFAEYHAEHAFEADIWNWGPPERGKPLYVQHCASCHGGQAGGDQALGAPSLAGMDNWYVQTQLQKFLAGLRGTHFKDPDGISMRAALDFMKIQNDPNDQISFLAHYLETLEPVDQPETVEGNAQRGESLYASCASCHGAGGEGNQALGAPPIAGQADWYLKKQLDKYRSGARGGDPRDTHGQQMANFARALPDEQAVKDVVAYIRTLEVAE
ncbi:PVC-type heme-binding CxxCH protein [Marinimicrobium sp. ARAG 43.8]|uniref:PVC-type heme-binding CxxCH protein n=1 Tax=Marinimicrobium sp. ARAG 43.8 TaxID=3418719 RepID=UPI003CEEFD48